MNKLVLLSLAVLAGVIGFTALRRSTQWTRAATLEAEGQWQAGSNGLAASQATAEALRSEVLDKKHRLLQVPRPPELSPELLQLLEGQTSKGHAAAWAELRRQLGLGWDASPDYVLVSKAALKQLEYKRLRFEQRPTDIASELLALSPAEQAAMASAVAQVRKGQLLSVQRAEPTGDIVAQYMASPLDPAAALSLSNGFAAAIAGVVGPERADLLLPQAWREVSGALAPSATETMTIRRTVTEGEPDLVCDMSRGQQVNTMPVRYAHYPSSWFLVRFPGGWDELARQEHFELPPAFRPH